jgi:hypothetical protein
VAVKQIKLGDLPKSELRMIEVWLAQYHQLAWGMDTDDVTRLRSIS